MTPEAPRPQGNQVILSPARGCPRTQGHKRSRRTAQSASCPVALAAEAAYWNIMDQLTSPSRAFAPAFSRAPSERRAPTPSASPIPRRARSRALVTALVLALPGAASHLMLSFPVLAASGEERPQSQQEYWAQFDQRDWDAAIEAAQQLVEVARGEPDQPYGLAEALTLLGNAQLGKADYEAAEAAFREALQVVSEHASSTSSHLLDPLRGLGYTLAREGRHGEAIPHLDRALLIAHRNYGLFDSGQQGILRQLAASLTRVGRPLEAERHMQYLLRVGERSYGRRDPRMAPLMCLVGDWYAELGSFGAARDQYRKAIELVERRLGREDLALVEPLRALARSYTLELLYTNLRLRTDRKEVPTDANGVSNDLQLMNPRYIDSDGEKALQRALSILERQARPPTQTLIETEIQLGDWFQIKGQPEEALKLYRRAASLVADSGSEQVPETANTAALSFPVRVYYPVPLLATRNRTLPPDEVEEKYVQVEFTVTEDGEVRDAHVVDHNATTRQASETLEAIRKARFRPRFVEGEPVATTGMIEREVFRVRKSTDAQTDS